VKIIVFGGGVVGVASAWYLAEAGHEVTVIERREGVGLETSFANGGQVSVGHAAPWAKPSMVPRILGWLGREDAPLLFRPRASWAQWKWGLGFLRECLPGRFEENSRTLVALARYSRERLRALRGELGLRYDQLERGILHFATRARDFEVMAREADSSKVKDARQCLEIEPALAHSADPVIGGVYEPDDESGDACRFTQELARAAAARGVTFRFGTPVPPLEAEGDRIQGEADAYVVALGSYSPLLLAPLGIRIPVYPLKGYSVTLPLGPAELEAAPTVSLTDEANKIVISRLGNRLRAAGTAELGGYDTSVNAVRCAAIARRIRELFPALGAITTVESWAGLRPATPSNVPLIGRTKFRNLFLNTGHGTLGWTLACGSGAALAELVSGRRPAVAFPFR
jgi:D-amino-acid dehydrogenase